MSRAVPKTTWDFVVTDVEGNRVGGGSVCASDKQSAVCAVRLVRFDCFNEGVDDDSGSGS